MGDINYYLRAKNEETAKSVIYLQYKYHGQVFAFFFRESIEPTKWSKAKQRVKDNKQTTKDGDHLLNDLLENLKQELLIFYRSHKASKGIPSPSTLKDHLNDYLQRNIVTEKKKTIWELIDRFISGEIKDPTTKQRKADGTLRHYTVLKNHLLAFEKKKKYTVSFETINSEFFDKYIDYLYSVGLSQNTISKNLKTLKVFLNRAIQEKLTHNTTFKEKGFSVKETESESVALSRFEISKLFKLDLSANRSLEAVRDLFIFGCNVGLRYSDYSQVKPHNIVEINGEKFIKIIQQKTGDPVLIPCHSDVLKIFKKYKDNPNSLPKAISGQKFNDYIKDACKQAGLTEKGRLMREPEKLLYDCISSHTARRSFCTNLYLEGVPAATIMKVSGHKTEASFFKYIKVSPLQAAEKLSLHFKKGKLMAV